MKPVKKVRPVVLQESFYRQKDVVWLARELLGKVLVTEIDGLHTAGIITETEAYTGPTDKASHAYGNRRTSRTETIYAAGGVAYIYLCYGIHHLFNIVTHEASYPYAVLVRAIEPLEGIDIMLERRGMDQVKPALSAGPGSMSAALGINRSLDGKSLISGPIWVEDRGIHSALEDIVVTTRIGVDYAKEDALLPYRFYLANSKFVSKKLKV